MKYFHSIKLTVFSYEHENSEEIFSSFLKFLPFDLEKNKSVVIKRNASGFNESKITIFEVILKKTNPVNQFIEFILKGLDEVQKEALVQQLESRLDENLDFFIRFDKEEWLKNGKLELTDSGKCFHLKMSVAAFPRNREIALRLVKELLER